MIPWKICLLLLKLLWMMMRMMLTSTRPIPVVFDSPPLAILAIHLPMQIWIVCMPHAPIAVVVIQICCCPSSHRQRGVLFHGIDWWCTECWTCCCWVGGCCYCCWNWCRMGMVTADSDCCCYYCCWNHRRRRTERKFVVMMATCG